jgi:small multidrug resistance pump
MTYFYLAIAIVTEVIGTSALKATEGFTKFWPSLIVVVGYAISIYYLTMVVKHMPIGVTYAIWSGTGVLLVAIIAAFWYKQFPDLAAIVGMALIVIGVIVINVFSKTVGQ